MTIMLSLILFSVRRTDSERCEIY